MQSELSISNVGIGVVVDSLNLRTIGDYGPCCVHQHLLRTSALVAYISTCCVHQHLLRTSALVAPLLQIYLHV